MLTPHGVKGGSFELVVITGSLHFSFLKYITIGNIRIITLQSFKYSSSSTLFCSLPKGAEKPQLYRNTQRDLGFTRQETVSLREICCAATVIILPL